jgi:3-isopropylmalate dehydrogenase
MKKYKIAVIPGDGIGREVIEEGLKVLDAVSEVEGLSFEYHKRYDLGVERYLKKEITITDKDLDELSEYKAIYFGALGDPRVKPGILESIILTLRRHFEQYVNLRPIKLYPGVTCPLANKGPEDIDFIVVRENTEGLYTNSGFNFKKGTPDEVAVQEMVNTRKGVERCIRYAFELAKKRERKKLTLVDKANVLTYAHDLWRRAFAEVGKEYNNVEQDATYVDATTMWFVKNPEWFDVIVTCNMFGDIITDLGAMLQGGLGLAAGANINPEGTSMFEPIHGSAPKYKGKNVANPIATILSGSLMLDFLGEQNAAAVIEKAVEDVLREGKVRTKDIGGTNSTSDMGDEISNKIKNK